MRSTTKRKWLRMVATCLLALQLNLLWIAGVHHHDQWVGLRSQTQGIQKGSSHSRPVQEGAIFCPVCQIVRQSAARPSTSSPTPEPLASIARLPAATPATFHSYAPVAVYGRAPPLA